jgi:hypothetical protein
VTGPHDLPFFDVDDLNRRQFSKNIFTIAALDFGGTLGEVGVCSTESGDVAAQNRPTFLCVKS